MFELLNVKWGPTTFGTPSGTITWSSEIDGDLPLTSSTDLDDIQNALRIAFDTWENVAAVEFEEVTSGGSVVVGTADLASPTVGQAGPFPSNPSSLVNISSVDVDFSTNQTWSAFGGDGGVNFFAVALHEIGHVIGLDHPEPADPSQIMNAEIAVSDLSDIDIAGAQFIYGTDGSDVPVDLPAADPPVLVASDDGGGGGGLGGLLLGLLALLVSIVPGGGSLLTMAAGRIGRQNDDSVSSADETEAPELITYDDLAAILGAPCGCDHTVDENGMVYHGVTVAGLMPEIDFTSKPNPCGCVGLCHHIIERDDNVEDVMV